MKYESRYLDIWVQAHEFGFSVGTINAQGKFYFFVNKNENLHSRLLQTTTKIFMGT